MKQEDFKLLQINVANKIYCKWTIHATATKNRQKTGYNSVDEHL